MSVPPNGAQDEGRAGPQASRAHGAPGVDGRPPRRLIDAGARRDGEARDGEAWGVELLRDAEPTRASAFRKQRIRIALGQHAGRRVSFALRPVIIVGVLGCAAAASAALGHWPRWIQNAYQQMVTAPLTEAAAQKSARPGSASRAEAVPPESPPVAETGIDAPVVPVPRDETSAVIVAHETLSARSTGTRHAGVRTHQGPRGAARTDRATALQIAAAPVAARVDVPVERDRLLPSPRATPATAVRKTEDTSAVSQAMRALRSDRDPVRARLLARHYLDQYPNGALAEEALAISVEAATTHHDADAAVLGALYLRLYPTGSFRARAQRAADNP